MTRVKICGLRREADIDFANRCLPDYIGFVFAPSRRRVEPEAAMELRRRLDPRIRAVGVFVNEAPDRVAGLCREGVIDLIQLHGDEDTAYIRALRAQTNYPVIRSVPVAETLPPALPDADYLLFDTPTDPAGVRGGTGRAFHWQALEGYHGPPFFLAGGLSPLNVREAVRRLHPFAVDVSSGVETDGWKDETKMKAFVRLVRGAG